MKTGEAFGEARVWEGGGGVIGLIAGQGTLPWMVLRGMLASGYRPVVAGFRGQADAGLAGLAWRFGWVGVARPGSWVRLLRRYGVREAVMVGRVRKSRLHSRWRWVQYWPDLLAVRIYYGLSRGDRRNEALLRATATALSWRGVELISSVRFCMEHLAGEGLLGGPAVGAGVMSDVSFGVGVCRMVVEHDIGQAVIVKEKDVIAVEAIEGTDRLIERAGELVPRGGWVLVKLAKREQDARFDVPVVGPSTVENVAKAGGRLIAVEAGGVLLVDREQTLAAADRLGVSVVGVRVGVSGVGQAV